MSIKIPPIHRESSDWHKHQISPEQYDELQDKLHTLVDEYFPKSGYSLELKLLDDLAMVADIPPYFIKGFTVVRNITC